MVEAIENFLVNNVGRELSVLLCALLPIIECRGAIPLGCGLGLGWWQNLLLAAAGNLLPVPFILLFIRAILRWMEGCRIKLFNRISGWLGRKVEKNKSTIEKYSYIGVMLFIAVPLPGTGAWTGSLIAAVLGMDWKKSTLAAIGGVLISCMIMTVISYGVKAIV